ncbi:MAG: glycosyltransferase [Gammaproteobacteria bacterium]|nr:glycosyltransferase [Gammaproteobacteria bacterium]
MNLAVVVPTLNAGSLWHDWINAIKSQSSEISITLVIDSGSTDETVALSLENGFKVHNIKKTEFDHGGTRQMALSLIEFADIVVFMTQDAILSNPDSITELISCFSDPSIGAAYGRQLPRKNADPIEAHGRLFNYPSRSSVKSLQDRDKYGFNLIFISNSFAAYKVSALIGVGGFPLMAIFGEDTYVCAKLLTKGWKISYQAKSEVFHSHGYNIIEEAKRYFDMGVFHSQQQWIIKEFGEPRGQGIKFITSEIKYLLKNSPQHIPMSILRNITKYFSYKLGRKEKYLPLTLKMKLSMNKSYWKNAHER